MKHFLFILSLLPFFLFSQTGNYTYYQDIEPIILNKCGTCHNSNGIAPFPLSSYNEVAAYSWIIPDVIANGEMPPWPPDTTYQRFVHERTLTVEEVTKITDWVWSGTPAGTPSNIDCIPTKSSPIFSETPDLVLQMPTYSSTATSQSDDYVCISIPTNFSVDKKIRAIEVIPGNKEILHHLLVQVDDISISSVIITSDCMGGASGGLISGWAPGSSPTIYPKDNFNSFGSILPAGGTVHFNLHYPEGSFGMMDSSKVAFYFYPDNEPNFRIVTSELLLSDFAFIIPPNQIQPIDIEYGPVAIDISALAVFPHMHLIGNNIKSFAITPQGDTIKLIDIPKWDFEWQDFYRFKNFIKIPAGSYIYLEGSHDNTSSNVNNPNSPPDWIWAGLNTTDEMFVEFLEYTVYQNGDENITLDDDVPAISGKITYANTVETPFSKTDIELLDDNNAVIQSITNALNGQYQFSGLPNGNYDIVPQSTQQVYGGVNATDALVIQNHTIGLTSLSDIYLTSADVNLSQGVNSSDALLVRQRFVGLINSFHSGTTLENDFVFDNEAVTLSGYNNCEEFKALALGDVNASYIPSSNKVSNVKLFIDKSISSLRVPIRIENAIEVSAISLVLITEKVQIDNVEFNYPSEDIDYNIIGNQLRFAWSNPEPIYFNSGDILFYITVEVLEPSSYINDYLFIGNETEFADKNANVLNGVSLSYPLLIIDDLQADMEASPNPVMDILYLNFINLPQTPCFIEIVDVAGKLLYIQDIIYDEISLELKLNQGLYFINLLTEDRVISSEKIILQ